MLIIHLGYSGFPIGNATMKRILLTFKAIKLGRLTPLIINKHSLHRIENGNHLNKFQGVPYINTSPILHRPESLIVRNINKFLGFVGEFFLILRKRKEIHAAIFYHSSVAELYYYRILSKVLDFKLIVHYVEFRSEIPERKNSIKHINDWLFDNFNSRLCDGFIVISEYLLNHVRKKNKDIPIIKIPAICDFEEFSKFKNINQSQYIMYCGGIMYLSIIEFIIDLYIELQANKLYTGELLLAIGGGENEIDGFKVLKTRIDSSGYKDKINLLKNVPHDELIEFYINSELLIVPLRNTIQDIAGFHHKIGEYCAARKPIISTSLAEMKFYFKDDESAILADEYSIESYMTRLSNILKDNNKLMKIGEEGQKVGLLHLNYKEYSDKLVHFLTTI